MPHPTTAPYGSWKSPITAQRIAAGAKSLAAPQEDDGQVYWLESVAAEGGRIAVARGAPGRPGAIVTPAPFNVRSRVHEYGGGASLVADGSIYFSNFADNLVYVQQREAPPRALTSDSRQRHADFVLDAPRKRLIAVREDHTREGEPPRNTIATIALDGSGGQVLAAGFDFYAAPRVSPDGRRLAWLCWNHPHMPWEGTELWLADFGADGVLANARHIAGGAGDALCQPRWSPRGELFVASDRSGWWNLYRVASDTLVAVQPMRAEIGLPMWVFGQSSYVFSGDDEIVAVCIDRATSRLARIDLSSGSLAPIATPFVDIRDLAAGDGCVWAVAASASDADCLVRIDLATGASDVVARSVDELPDAGDLSSAEAIEFASANGRTAHAFFYPPRNRDFEAPCGELPPLLVCGHGGPTSMSGGGLRLAYQFWTSRGFAVLDVNYGGSTGFGSAYRKLLDGQWGVVDVDDCVAGARHLAAQGRVDARRMAIRGGSAGGFTTLAALAFHDVFKAGASYYGVADLTALDADTHKFESHYTSSLVAPPGPDRDRLYAERSPLLHAARIACPVIFFQGLDDKVVPPAQSRTMVAALKACGVATAYLEFEGEGHGFRREETIARALEAEASFYAQVFGFELAGEIEPVAIDAPAARG